MSRKDLSLDILMVILDILMDFWGHFLGVQSGILGTLKCTLGLGVSGLYGWSGQLQFYGLNFYSGSKIECPNVWAHFFQHQSPKTKLELVE